MGQGKCQQLIPATGSMTAEIDKYTITGAGSMRQQFNLLKYPGFNGFLIDKGMDIFFFETKLCRQYFEKRSHIVGWALERSVSVLTDADQQSMVFGMGNQR